MVKGIVYGNATSFRTQKVLIAARAAAKTVDQIRPNPPADKFPLGITPAYEEGDLTIFGADAIAKHIARENKTYVPDCPTVDQWLLWAESELLPNVLAYVLPSLSYAQVDQDTVEHARKEFIAQLQHLDKVLVNRTYLVGERLSVADVSVALNLVSAFKSVLDPKTRKGLINVTRWFNTVVHQPYVQRELGGVHLAEQVSTFNQDTYKKQQSSAPASTSAKKDDKKSKTPQPQEKKEKPAKPAKEQEPEDDTPQEEKFVDPFTQFPGGDFNMDAFKRVYSNEDTETKALPYFWEKFDPEHYSIWYGEYKYPEDLTLTFMSCNLISGMMQRLDKMRKHAFGSMCLFGGNNDSTISGLWFWRGPKLAFELSPDWQVDYESYAWKKLDPKDEETKKLVHQYFTWEGFENKKPFNQGKIFK